MTDETTAEFESKSEALKSAGGTRPENEVKLWLAAIEASSREEKDWRELAHDVVDIYRSEDEKSSETQFNILYSNTETMLPALYNSTPIPDIRRRFGDPGKEPKAVCDILERALSYMVDVGGFDNELRLSITDACLVGRGLTRERWVPTVEGNAILDQTVPTEYVPWSSFRRGPGRTWADVPWVAFELFLTKDQVTALAGPAVAKLVPLDCNGYDEKDESEESSAPEGDIFKRARVWEVWDREAREVLFIAPGYKAKVIKREDDPLQLTGFFPCPEPMEFIRVAGETEPVPPYTSYRRLAEELNEVSRRITKLVRQLRVRGIYASPASALQNILNADDGELVPAEGLEMFIDAGGLDKAISWWPMEPTVKALAQLIEHREMVKQTIYEVSGLSDILRGASAASETATAQQIKNQWGSLRIQRAQQEVQRYCRDIFRMKAEIIATRFGLDELTRMTGVELISDNERALIQQQMQMAQQQAQMTGQQPQIPPEIQQKMELPSAEQVEGILRDDVMRSFKVDVESDSTIRADLTRNQQTMAEFVQGTAAYIQAVGPAVQAGLLPADVAVDIYAAFARNFKLGKSVEDTLDRMSSNAREQAQQPQEKQPDPKLLEVAAKWKADKAKLAMDAQAAQQKAQLEAEKTQAQLALEKQKAEMEMALKEQQAAIDRDIKMQTAGQEMEMKAQQHQLTLEQVQKGLEFDSEKHRAELERGEVESYAGLSRMERETALKERMAEEKAKPAKEAKSKKSSIKIVRDAKGRVTGAERSD
jgi:hypothetical protein